MPIKIIEYLYDNYFNKETLIASILIVGIYNFIYKIDDDELNYEDISSNSNFSYSLYSNSNVDDDDYFGDDDCSIDTNCYINEYDENTDNNTNTIINTNILEKENEDNIPIIKNYDLYDINLDTYSVEYLSEMEKGIEELNKKNLQLYNLYKEVENLKNSINTIKSRLNIKLN